MCGCVPTCSPTQTKLSKTQRPNPNQNTTPPSRTPPRSRSRRHHPHTHKRAPRPSAQRGQRHSDQWRGRAGAADGSGSEVDEVGAAGISAPAARWRTRRWPLIEGDACRSADGRSRSPQQPYRIWEQGRGWIIQKPKQTRAQGCVRASVLGQSQGAEATEHATHSSRPWPGFVRNLKW